MKAITIFVLITINWGPGSQEAGVDVRVATGRSSGVSVSNTLTKAELFMLQAMTPELPEAKTVTLAQKEVQ